MPEYRTDCAPAHRSSTKTAKLRKRLGVVFGSLLLIALCAGIRHYWGAQPARAGTSEVAVSSSGQEATVAVRDPRPSSPAAGSSAAATAHVVAEDSAIPAIVATVNTQRITREELARECCRRHGKEVLEMMVNKHLIVEECRRRGISVTRAEVDAEIEPHGKAVQHFRRTVAEGAQAGKEHDARPVRRRSIWPILALRKLAGERLSISPDELVREYETMYGESVRCLLIAVSSPEKARDLQARAAARPDEFGELAKQFSEDAASASVKGVIQPIRKHGSYKEIEDAVFNMPDGAVSPVIHAGGQYVILKREGLLPAREREFREDRPASWKRSSATAKCGPWPRTSFANCRPTSASRTSGTTRRNSSRCRAWPVPSTARRSPSASWTTSVSRGTAGTRSKG